MRLPSGLGKNGVVTLVLLSLLQGMMAPYVHAETSPRAPKVKTQAEIDAELLVDAQEEAKKDRDTWLYWAWTVSGMMAAGAALDLNRNIDERRRALHELEAVQTDIARRGDEKEVNFEKMMAAHREMDNMETALLDRRNRRNSVPRNERVQYDRDTRRLEIRYDNLRAEASQLEARTRLNSKFRYEIYTAIRAKAKIDEKINDMMLNLVRSQNIRAARGEEVTVAHVIRWVDSHLADKFFNTEDGKTWMRQFDELAEARMKQMKAVEDTFNPVANRVNANLEPHEKIPLISVVEPGLNRFAAPQFAQGQRDQRPRIISDSAIFSMAENTCTKDYADLIDSVAPLRKRASWTYAYGKVALTGGLAATAFAGWAGYTYVWFPHRYGKPLSHVREEVALQKKEEEKTKDGLLSQIEREKNKPTRVNRIVPMYDLMETKLEAHLKEIVEAILESQSPEIKADPDAMAELRAKLERRVEQNWKDPDISQVRASIDTTLAPTVKKRAAETIKEILDKITPKTDAPETPEEKATREKEALAFITLLYRDSLPQFFELTLNQVTLDAVESKILGKLAKDTIKELTPKLVNPVSADQSGTKPSEQKTSSNTPSTPPAAAPAAASGDSVTLIDLNTLAEPDPTKGIAAMPPANSVSSTGSGSVAGALAMP